MSSATDEELFSSPHLYRLLRSAGGTLAIEVVVGGFAMSTVRVALNSAETADYHRDGRAATDRLAKSISENPSYFGRAVPQS
jgi:hypothetical protein